MTTENKERTRRGGGRKKLAATRGATGPPQLPFGAIKNPYPPFNILSDDQVQTIHETSLDILETIGMRVQNLESRELLKQAGADIDTASEDIKLDRHFVEEMITGLASEFDVIARNPEKTLTVGGNNLCFATVCGPSFVSDLDEGRRRGTYDKMCDFIKIAHMLNIVQHEGGAGFEPLDLPVASRHMDMMYAQITLTDKGWYPCWLNSGPRARDVIEMTKIALGLSEEELLNTPTIQSGVNTNSPLLLDDDLASGMIELAKVGQPICVTPFTLAGAMSPITLAGTLAQQNAEVLLSACIVQAARRGTPMIYGHFASNVDMKTGSPAFGTPEYVKTTLASAQMARFYGWPFRSSNTTAAQSVDAQASYESMMSLWGNVLSHTNIVLHGFGWLEGGLTCSFEKLILDAELVQMLAETLKPIGFTKADLAIEAIADVGAGGHFFGTPHTMERYQNAFYAPMISDWRNFENWEEDGSKTATQRANGVWKELLAAYEKPPIDPSIEEELQAYMAKRKEYYAAA